MNRAIDQPVTAAAEGHVTRRIFLGSLAALAAAPRSFAQAGPPIPISGINHMTLSVSDPARSLEWYQGLFGMPIAARQANTVILRVGRRAAVPSDRRGRQQQPKHQPPLPLDPRLQHRPRHGGPGKNRGTRGRRP